MLYQISRGGQTYGPYTLADLQRYVASGHVLATDLAKSDEMAEWVPVSQILNPSGLPPDPAAAPPASYANEPIGYAPQPVAAPLAMYPDPPNLNWGLVLLFDFLTCGVFQFIWNFVISGWMKRVQPSSQAIIYYAVGYGLLLVSSGLSFPSYIAILHHTHSSPHFGASLVSIVAWVVRIVARFNLKASLEQHFNTVEPIGLRMNGALVFFFGGLYIQSELNRINGIKQAVRYREFGR